MSTNDPDPDNAMSWRTWPAQKMQFNPDLRSWPVSDLQVLARAAGILWDSTGRADPYDVLNAYQAALLDRAAASYLTADQTEPSQEELAELGARMDAAAERAREDDLEKGPCLDCGREVRADRKGNLWATDPNDGHPLWCYDPAVPFSDRPSKSHRLAAEMTES